MSSKTSEKLQILGPHRGRTFQITSLSHSENVFFLMSCVTIGRYLRLITHPNLNDSTNTWKHKVSEDSCQLSKIITAFNYTEEVRHGLAVISNGVK